MQIRSSNVKERFLALLFDSFIQTTLIGTENNPYRSASSLKLYAKCYVGMGIVGSRFLGERDPQLLTAVK